jgi:hypothetical protein
LAQPTINLQLQLNQLPLVTKLPWHIVPKRLSTHIVGHALAPSALTGQRRGVRVNSGNSDVDVAAFCMCSGLATCTLEPRRIESRRCRVGSMN